MFGSKDLFSNLDLVALVHRSFIAEFDEEVFKNKQRILPATQAYFWLLQSASQRLFFSFLGRKTACYTVLAIFRPFSRNINVLRLKKKSCILESPTLSTDVDSRTDTILEILFIHIFFWRGGLVNFFFLSGFFLGGGGEGGPKTFKNQFSSSSFY